MPKFKLKGENQISKSAEPGWFQDEEAQNKIDELDLYNDSDVVNQSLEVAGDATELKANEETEEIPRKRLAKALSNIEQSPEILEGELRKRTCILADSDGIENQEINIIDARDQGIFQFNFKLTESKLEKVINKLRLIIGGDEEELESLRSGLNYEVIDSRIAYKSLDSTGQSFYVAEAYKIEYEGLTIKVSQTTPEEFDQRTSIGLVTIEVEMSTDENLGDGLGEIINKILTEILEIKGGLTEPDQEAIRNYKLNRYKWHHKLDQLPENTEEIEEKLSREEVFPGYFTMVEKGKHQEYQELSSYAVYHNILSISTLAKILDAGGLMSSHERYRRGLFVKGVSTGYDFDSGGADSVFVRTATEDGLKKRPGFVDYGVDILLHPRIYDRTDWYAFAADEFGRSGGEDFEKRQSPEELFRVQKEYGHFKGNEQMFRCGISSSDFIAIVCSDDDKRNKVYRELQEAGINEINGKSIDEFIVVAENRKAQLELTKRLTGNSEV